MHASPDTSIPTSFKHRRLQSLMGLWLVIYLIFHLLANSQAALLFGENGNGFVRAANEIRDLPYLPIIEIVLLAIPFLIHISWGIERLLMAKSNSFPSDGSTPSLEEYPRNKAYTWQRITSWILLVLIAAHVIHMRFLEQPSTAQKGSEKYYMVRLNADDGLYPLVERLGATLYNQTEVQKQQEIATQQIQTHTAHSETPHPLVEEQAEHQEEQWIQALTERPLEDGQVIAVSNNFGTVELLMIRDTFKMPVMLFFYTVLVLSACFHAFNGLWTACITWGITLSPRSQRMMRTVSIGLMLVVTFLGLAAIWGTYWINLRQ